MSQEACNQFFAKVNADSALQQEVNTALSGKEGEEAATAFVWVGAKHGYEFTTAEATQKYQEIIAAAEWELEEEALDQVAGGGAPGDRARGRGGDTNFNGFFAVRCFGDFTS